MTSGTALEQKIYNLKIDDIKKEKKQKEERLAKIKKEIDEEMKKLENNPLVKDDDANPDAEEIKEK